MKLAQFAQSIKSIGQTNTILAQGEPGIGKSAVLKMLKKELSGFEIAYIDCAQLDLGDFALPYTENTDGGGKITHFAPNARFKAHLGKPVCIMLDELGKAMRSVQNVLLTLLLEHRLGDVTLPEGSIVFATTNLASDGVGDKIEAHARNRMVVIKVDKPTTEEWVEWGMFSGISPVVMAFVKAFPQVLSSYTTNTRDNNPYIFNPHKQQISFVTPRSLEAASNIIKQKDSMGPDVLVELLSGAVGAAAAADMSTFIAMGSQQTSWAAIMKNPQKAKVATSAVVRTMQVHAAIQKIHETPETEFSEVLSAWLIYMQRLDMELQAMFCMTVAKNVDMLKRVATNKSFIALNTANSWVL